MGWHVPEDPPALDQPSQPGSQSPESASFVRVPNPGSPTSPSSISGPSLRVPQAFALCVLLRRPLRLGSSSPRLPPQVQPFGCLPRQVSLLRFGSPLRPLLTASGHPLLRPAVPASGGRARPSALQPGYLGSVPAVRDR